MLGPKKFAVNAVVVGDLRMDVKASLGDYAFSAEDARFTQLRHIAVEPGGTALAMARALSAVTMQCHIVGAIGIDMYMDEILQACQEYASPVSLEEHRMPNGFTLSCFTGRPGEPGRRFSVAAPRSPYFSLSSAWIESRMNDILAADILTTDCLLLTSTDTHKVANLLHQIGCQMAGLFAVDVVPHNIVDYVEKSEVLKFLTGVEILTIELDTLADLLDYRRVEQPTPADAEDLYREIARHLAPRHWASIRFGAQSMATCLLIASDGTRIATNLSEDIESGKFPSGSDVSAREYAHVFTSVFGSR